MDPLLAEEVGRYASRGYHVVSQSETNVQLVKPKRFNLLAFVLMLGVFYLPFYLAAKGDAVFLYVEDGRVQRRGGKWSLGGWIAGRRG